MRRFIALPCAFLLAAVVAPVAAQPSGAPSLSDEELREFAAVFADVRANAGGFPSADRDGAQGERRSSVEVIEAHGWTLAQYNRAAHAVNSDRQLFLRLQSILGENG